jgi:hypothetical protein
MGTGSYIGAHTKIFISDGGTRWEVSDRPANQPDDSRRTGGTTKSRAKLAAGGARSASKAGPSYRCALFALVQTGCS